MINTQTSGKFSCIYTPCPHLKQSVAETKVCSICVCTSYLSVSLSSLASFLIDLDSRLSSPSCTVAGTRSVPSPLRSGVENPEAYMDVKKLKLCCIHTSTRPAQAEEAIQQYRDNLATRSVASLFYQRGEKKARTNQSKGKKNACTKQPSLSIGTNLDDPRSSEPHKLIQEQERRKQRVFGLQS